jgi:hypothetical protein
MAAAFNRERTRTVALAVLGLVFFATAIVPVVESIVHPPRCTAGPMLNAVGGVLLMVFAPRGAISRASPSA